MVKSFADAIWVLSAIDVMAVAISAIRTSRFNFMGFSCHNGFAGFQ